jgi:ABC-type phosphate transport system substrate-binding protein
MKVKTLTLAVASAVAASAALQANAAYFEPWTVTGSETYTLKLAGSTAQDKGIILLMRRMCQNNSMVRVANSNNSAIMCLANGGDSAPIPANTPLILYKNSTGGSGNGVKPVSNFTNLAFLARPDQAYTQAQYTTASLCTVTTVASTTDFADYKNYACPSVGTVNTPPDAGISDVEPNLLGWVPVSQGGSDQELSSFTGPQVIFGVPVSRNFYEALQAAQGKTVGSRDESQLPSLTKAQIASIFNGGLLPVIRLSDNNGVQLTAPSGSNNISICRRKAGSGTLAGFNAYFLNDPCAKGMKTMVSGLAAPNDGDTLIAAGVPASVANRVNEYGGTPAVIGCLNANHQANKFAIGMATTEIVAGPTGSAYTNTGLAAPFDTDTGNWGWVKVQGYAPSLLNVAQGKYDVVYEATYQHRAAGNPFGELTGNPKALFDRVVATNGSAVVIKELDSQFVQAPSGTTWAAGLLGKPGTPTAPSAAPAGVLTEAEVLANPVNTWTRAASGTPNSCQPPYVTRETGLNMLQ